MNIDRRSFFTGSLAAGAALVSGTRADAQQIPGAETWNPDPAVPRDEDRILNIGGVFGLWSHTSSTWWKYLNPPEGFARATGMRISHLWCVDRDCGRRLAERYDAELVDTYDGMTDAVDGVFIDDFFVTPFMPDLSMPYLEAGVPCFFDRPMASGMRGARQVIDTSRRTGTPFMTASAYEYLKEVETAHHRIPRIGDITAYEARNAASNVYMYVLHGLWFALRVIGTDVAAISHRTPDPVNAPGLTILEHNRDGRTFYGTLHNSRFRDIMCSIRAYGTEGDTEVTCEVDGRPWNRDIFTYLEMLHAFERMIRTGEMPQTHEYVEQKMRIFISVLYSVYERNGGTVPVAALPEDWDAGIPTGFSRSYSDEIIDAYRRALKR